MWCEKEVGEGQVQGVYNDSFVGCRGVLGFAFELEWGNCGGVGPSGYSQPSPSGRAGRQASPGVMIGLWLQLHFQRFEHALNLEHPKKATAPRQEVQPELAHHVSTYFAVSKAKSGQPVPGHLQFNANQQHQPASRLIHPAGTVTWTKCETHKIGRQVKHLILECVAQNPE